jgi:hypothetical protein
LHPGYDVCSASDRANAFQIAAEWARGDRKGIKLVEELLAQAGLSIAEVNLRSLSAKSFERLDERDERLAGRRDEILRQIEPRRSGWAKLVRRASDEIVEGEFHELPLGTPDIEAGPTRRTGQAADRTHISRDETMVVNDRRVRANRANAERSTGPRTKAGKAVTRLNALRHGLAAVHNETATDQEIETLALTIVGDEGGSELLALARWVADAELGLRRVRSARTLLANSPPAHLNLRADLSEASTGASVEVVIPVRSLAEDFEAGALDRYERRARSRRKFAIRDYDAARAAWAARQQPTVSQ